MVLFSFIACAPVYKLESGDYVMSLKTPSKTENIPQNVVITVEKEKVIIKNSQKDGELVGILKGNAFKIERKTDNKSIVFSGQLTGDNMIVGEVVEKDEENQTVKAPFSIKKQSSM